MNSEVLLCVLGQALCSVHSQMSTVSPSRWGHACADTHPLLL